MQLTDFKALTFDCYGTLIDWETGMVDGLKPLTSRVGSDLSRDDILEAHARHESSQQSWTPTKRYCELLPISTSAWQKNGVCRQHLKSARHTADPSKTGRLFLTLSVHCSI